MCNDNINIMCNINNMKILMKYYNINIIISNNININNIINVYNV